MTLICRGFAIQMLSEQQRKEKINKKQKSIRT